jgi:hypothetical protein
LQQAFDRHSVEAAQPAKQQAVLLGNPGMPPLEGGTQFEKDLQAVLVS